MLAARLYGPGDIRVEEVPDPEPGPGEALVRVRTVGVCASDLHFYRHGEIGGWGFQEPALLGHECAGVIIRWGEGSLAGEGPPLPGIGERVAMEPTRPCGICDRCRSGRYNVCRRLRFAGQPPDPGAFCEYITAPASRLFPLPAQMDFDQGAMVEPVAVAVHAVRLAGVKEGNRVAVLGVGAIGLSILQVAAAYGAREIYVSEPLPHRRKLAEEMGAIVLDPGTEDPTQAILHATGAGVEVAFEASGSAEGPAQAARWIDSGGVLSLVGIPEVDELTLPASVLRRREITIRTVRRYCNDFDQALALIASGQVKAERYATHRFPLQETGAAFAAAADQPDEVVRAMVDVPATDRSPGGAGG